MDGEVHAILVRMPNWLGDLVMATPVLVDLRAKFPNASITAMCKSSLCELLRQDETIDELFCFTRPENGFLRRQSRDVIAKIRQAKFDLAVLLTNSFSSAWVCWQGKIPRRIGYPGHFRKWMLTEVVPPPSEPMHQVDQYKRLLEPLGIPRSATSPSLFVSDEEMERARELLCQQGHKKGEPWIGINPGAAYGLAKCWPPEYFRKLALDLCTQWRVVFFGDGSSIELVKSICRDLPSNVIDLAGLTSLRELACLIKDCSLLISNDSGPMHIADAWGTPLIALFGSTDDAATGPYRQKEAVINKRVTCSPCLKRVCPIDFRCMKQITVEEVAFKARKILGTKHV